MSVVTCSPNCGSVVVRLLRGMSSIPRSSLAAAAAGRSVPIRRSPAALKMVPGSAATARATCTTISAVHVRPSWMPAPRDENCWRLACTRLPVAFSAGSTPMRTAATMASAPT